MTQLLFQCRKAFTAGFQLDIQFAADKLVTALYGPSGSGKSTILSLTAGLLHPDSGRIQLGQRVLVDTAQKLFLPPEHRHIALVLQDHCLFPHLNVEQNLKYGMLRQPPAEHNSSTITFDHVIETLELQELIKRTPRTLSGGEQQRVALGRALLCKPEFLLLDEPLTGLDTELKDRIITLLKRVIDEYHIPMLLVTHDQWEVQQLASHVIILKDGQITRQGHLADVLPQSRHIDDFD